VRDIDSIRRSESTLRGILELLKPFEVETVAEFVENDTVARKAGMMGCDYGQGYAFGAPQPLAEAISSLKADESRKLRRLSLEI
jgi:EAL domain-containing protein (putative c-di-GMP-specific phosphodiesterase class I)